MKTFEIWSSVKEPEASRSKEHESPIRREKIKGEIVEFTGEDNTDQEVSGAESGDSFGSRIQSSEEEEQPEGEPSTSQHDFPTLKVGYFSSFALQLIFHRKGRSMLKSSFVHHHKSLQNNNKQTRMHTSRTSSKSFFRSIWLTMMTSVSWHTGK